MNCQCRLFHLTGKTHLTGESTYSTVCLSTGNKANRARCANTLRGPNPTLSEPVYGLRSIILHRRTFVLREPCGPTESPVGLGRFVFPVGGKAYA